MHKDILSKRNKILIMQTLIRLMYYSSPHFKALLLFPILILLKLKLVHCLENQMIINTNAENTDPFSGFENPFRRQQKLDTDAIVIQRSNRAVTTYHLVDDANGHPIFTRPYRDRGKKFIFFNNPSFPTGSGHYIVLRKMDFQRNKNKNFPTILNRKAVNVNPFNTMPQLFYETFTLSFKDSISGSVTDLDPFQYSAVKRRPGHGNYRYGRLMKARKRARRVKRGARVEKYSFSTVIDLDSFFTIGNFTT